MKTDRSEERAQILKFLREESSEQEPFHHGEIALLLELQEPTVSTLLCYLLPRELHLHRRVAPKIVGGKTNRYAYWYDASKQNPFYGAERLSNRQVRYHKEGRTKPSPFTRQPTKAPVEQPTVSDISMQEFQIALTAVNSFLADNSDIRVRVDGRRVVATVVVEKEL